MGVIQQGINQGLGLAALGVSQIPSVKAKLETNKEIAASEMAAEKARQSLEASNATLQEVYDKIDFDNPATVKQFEAEFNDLKKQHEIASGYANQKFKEAFELNPTSKNLRNYQFLTDSLQSMQSEANNKAQEVKEAKITQRRKFKDYLAQMPYSVGGQDGIIGNLPEKTQNLFAKQYNAKDRKSIMDKMDKERKEKN